MSAADGLYANNVVAEVKQLNPYGNVDSVDMMSIEDTVIEGHTLVVAYCTDLEEVRKGWLCEEKGIAKSAPKANSLQPHSTPYSSF